MEIRPKYIVFLLVNFLMNLDHSVILAQNAKETFGKNKIQYNTDQQDWWIYETSNIVYYWYGKSRNYAHFIINLAEAENQEILSLFEYHPKEKIELIIYSDLSDFQQSNIDLSHTHTPELWNLEPKIKEQKILLYFNGDHRQGLKMLRKGLAQVYFNFMFSGSNFQEVIQKVISYKLPPWFEAGLIEYIGEGWTLHDKSLLNGLWNRKYSFKKFSSRHPILAGKSFWNFIYSQYGEKSLSSWLYLIRIQKDLNQATQMVFQQSLDDLFEHWREEMIAELGNDKITKPKGVPIKLKKEESIIRLNHSDVLGSWVFVTDQNNRKRIRILDKDLKELKTIYKSGHRNKLSPINKIYPIFSENIDNKLIGIIDEYRNRIRLSVWHPPSNALKRHILPTEIQAIYDFKFVNPNQIYFSGSNNGFSDLFIYNINGRAFNKITDDLYDDLQFSILNSAGSTKIQYLSNRPLEIKEKNNLDSILPLDPFKLFEIDQEKNSSARSIYAAKLGSTIKDYQRVNENEYLFIECDDNGKTFLYSNLKQTRKLNEPFLDAILADRVNGRMISLYKDFKGKFRAKSGQYQEKIQKAEIITNSDSLAHSEVLKDSLRVSIRNTGSKFVSEYNDPPFVDEIVLKAVQAEPVRNSKKTEDPGLRSINKRTPQNLFNPIQSIAYRNRFQIEETSANINNDLLFGGLNTFTGFNQNFNLPRLGLLLKIKVREIFENYNLEAGIRIPTNLNGSETYLLYENRKGRWDHTWGLYRRAISNNVNVNNFETYRMTTNTFLLNHQILFALDPYRGFRLNSTIRNDHNFFKGSDQTSLDSNGLHIQSIGTRIEYVYDDALDLGVNLKQGSQLKFYLETMKRFQFQKGSDPAFTSIPGMLFIAGIDARHHIPILRHSVFSNRFFFNSSFGKLRMLNHLGGTENWLLPKYGNESGSVQESNYAFAQLATEIRGFPLGIRRGSSVMGLNSEIRIPFFQYILSQSWRNSFLRNLQFIGFLDAGMSWNGILPNLNSADELRVNVSNPAVVVDIRYYRNPVLSSMGVGLRSSIFGYYLRFDYGWPFDFGGYRKPLAHFSLGLDF